MSDLIERETAIKTVTNLMKNEDDWYREAFKSAIRAIPSARPKYGTWKAKSFHEVYCDNCGFTFDIMKCDFLENMKICPNCGADMRGADNGADNI